MKALLVAIGLGLMSVTAVNAQVVIPEEFVGKQEEEFLTVLGSHLDELTLRVLNSSPSLTHMLVRQGYTVCEGLSMGMTQGELLEAIPVLSDDYPIEVRAGMAILNMNTVLSAPGTLCR